MEDTTKHHNRVFNMHIIVECLAIGAILLLAAYLRLHNVTDNPGWYTDETTHIIIAQHLLEGRTQYLSINQSFLLFGRLPLFEYTLAGTMKIFSPDITTLRLLTGSLGVISVGTLYAGLRVVQEDRLFPLLAALMLTLYPSAVLYSRFGFSYTLLTPLVIIICTGLIYYLNTGRQRGLFVTTVALGLGLISDLMIVALLPVMLLLILLRRPSDLLWSLPVVALPFTTYSLVMLITAPDPFLFDLHYTLGRMSSLSPQTQATYLLDNYRSLMQQESLLLPAILGLILLKPANVRLVWILAIGIPIIVLGRTVALYSLSFYYMIPLLPAIAIGLASLLRYGLSMPMKDATIHIPARIMTAAIMLFFVGLPLLDAANTTIKGVHKGFNTPIEPFLVDGDEARQIADYINTHTNTQSYVIAPPPVAWMLISNVSDIQTSIAATGQETPHLPAEIPVERYVFETDYQQADYVVVDPVWRNWGNLHLPGADTILSDIESNWLLILDTGNNQVYANPNQP